MSDRYDPAQYLGAIEGDEVRDMVDDALKSLRAIALNLARIAESAAWSK